ncbi:MAG: HDOD domain-containing protein [Deltaproteobacteria bacterium]|nr:HDOD domain-containing protein [Deltaproteobacteria bacterium]
MNSVMKIEDAPANPSRKDALRARVNEMTNVSTVPAVLKRIMELTDNPNAIVSDLEKVIERDQAIAMRVVSTSNAAFYGFSRKISTISQAILVLGFDMVRGLAITTTVFNSIPVKNKESLLALWAHSFETAQAAMIIARKTGLVEKESAFLAGLFHDIGRPVLYQVCGDECAGTSPFDRISIQREEEVFGASHAEVGSWFAEKFKLTEDCMTAIQYHHNPEEYSRPEKLPPIVAIIYLANLVTDIQNAVLSPDHEGILASVKLTPEDLAAFSEEIAKFKETTRSFYA